MKIKYWQGFSGWYVQDNDRIPKAHLLSRKGDRWVCNVASAFFPSLQAAKEGLKLYFENHPEELAKYVANRILAR